jgi:putative ABC transport system permease protein
MIDSFKRNLDESFSTLGNDIVYVNKFAWMPEPGESEYAWWHYKVRAQVKQKELRKLKRDTQVISYGSMLYTDNSDVQFNEINLENISISAVNYEFNQLQKFEIQYGRYFSKREMDATANVAIIGSEIAKELFGTNNSEGRIIKIFNRPFVIIGQLAEQGKNMAGFDYDNGIIISYNYYSTFKNPEDDRSEFTDNTMMLKVNKKLPMNEALYEIKGNLRAQRKVKPTEKDNFSMNILSSIQQSINAVFVTVDLAGFIIGLFSLLVGAFGIANIMFVSVKERTPQIGLKKALGAQPKVILQEFMLEAILLCILGGLIGMFLVIIGAFIINYTADFKVYFSLGNFVLGLAISTVVGLISGYAPARRASNLNPITAIRS